MISEKVWDHETCTHELLIVAFYSRIVNCFHKYPRTTAKVKILGFPCEEDLPGFF